MEFKAGAPRGADHGGVRGGVNWGNWRNGLETGGGEEREGDLGFQQPGQSLR